MRLTHLVGARTHNLQSVSLDLRPGELVVLTGVSGAGKSSLAIDTLYAEGQRRFIESFSPYARQFLERLERPPVDLLDPVAAGVAVDRRAPVKSSRSTVATMADLEPYLSALFTREARPVCPDCKVLAVWTDPRSAAEQVQRALPATRAVVTYPVRVAGTADYLDVRERLAQEGYRRLLVGGEVRDIDDVKPSEVTTGEGVALVVVDRVETGKSISRLAAAVEQAWARGGGQARVVAAGSMSGAASAAGASGTAGAARETRVARGLSCPECARAFQPARASLFSYQSPVGACAACRGFGRTIGIDWGKVVPDPRLSIKRGAIKPWSGKSSKMERSLLFKFCDRRKIPIDLPWSALSEPQRRAVIDGEGSWDQGKFPGVAAWFSWMETRTYKMHVRVLLSRFRSYELCSTCHGARLNDEARSYQVGGRSLSAWHELEIRDARDELDRLTPENAQGEVIRRELLSRLSYLVGVGLGYLSLSRQARTLSGGEAQRVALTAALGTALTGALIVLDEPTVGLHPADIPPLTEAMRQLASRGNTVLTIEHDPAVLLAADRAIELGPGAGLDGGRVLFDGPPAELARRADLPTGKAMLAARGGGVDGQAAQPAQAAVTGGKARGRAAAGRKSPVVDVVPTGNVVPWKRREASSFLVVKNAREHNLLGVDVRLPLGVVCALTGPSGSGKSTLARDIVYRAVARARGDMTVEPAGAHDGIDGLALVRDVVHVDQSPLGRTSRGNAATYTKAWDRMRARFAAEPEAAARELGPAAFSFNVAGGRCEACSGEGSETVEMQFLADVSLVCPACHGRRFQPHVLEVKHAGLSVADMLEAPVAQVLSLFPADAALQRALRPVAALGLGYLPLGQPLNTLSGGEAQRLKLARALSAPSPGTLFVLDEPSAGLHAADTEHVIRALRTLVEAGASVLVVDHDLDVIEAADWVVDLGPGAGRHGGKVVAEGTPDALRATGVGLTADALRRAREPLPPVAAAASREARAAGDFSVQQPLRVERAREHNLHDVSCELPLGKLVVVTGPSGSGKSTLAFDVIFAEGQRRFLETLTPYARQFLPMMPRADVDRVTGVPPSIALEQRTTRAGANSTVATVTEVAHYLRLLFAKVGEVHCPSCDAPVRRLSPDDLLARLRALKGKPLLLAPAVRARKGTYLDVFTAASRAGFAEAVCDGERVKTDAPPKLKKTVEHTIDIVVSEGASLSSLASPESLTPERFQRALALGKGALSVVAKPGAEPQLFSTSRSCPRCGEGVPELDPRWFSFNTKQGQCEACEGSGLEGGPGAGPAGHDAHACRACEGSRLAPLPRGVRLCGLRYHEFMNLSVGRSRAAADGFSFEGDQARIAEAPLGELRRRLGFLENVGLSYLSLGRAAFSLSGGEMQRLRLSAQLGAGLTGALYVLDEPTIGLHPRDTRRLLANLRALVDTGSTVLVVEHDADTIRAADHLIDLGPSGGRQGGRIVAQGAPSHVLASPHSPTARALAVPFSPPRPPRAEAAGWLKLTGARANNLREVTLEVPLGRMTVVAGVSGSGKSTLVHRVLLPAVRKALGLAIDEAPGPFKKLDGHKALSRALAVDQSPIGRTPRSVPATFLGIWDEIRKLYAASPGAQVAGFDASRFSFNTPRGGRCPACEGQGVITHEMAFLPEVVSPCEACSGLRFEPRTLEIQYLGRSVGEALRMTAREAAEHFKAHPKIVRPLVTLDDLGVGYLQIGQGSHTLSGGEAQRLKLAAELTAGSKHEPTLYVLDEPTTGLHLGDVARLVEVLARLVDRGDTLVVVEHHPWVIAAADHVVELGPEGGEGGGMIVAEGSPAHVARQRTATGPVIAEVLGTRAGG
jgi:excinuclease ABC subunit A